MTPRIAIGNLKGGTGKTTLTTNIGACLAHKGVRVLLIDADPQCSASEIFFRGDDFPPEEHTLAALYNEKPLQRYADIIHRTRIEELDIVPASDVLALAAVSISELDRAPWRIADFLNEVDGVYDLVILDTHPDLGIFTLGALLAAQHILVPLQPERPAVTGFARFWETLSLIAEASPVDLLGIICSQLDERGKSHKEWHQQMIESFADRYIGYIHRATAVNEASDLGLTLREHNTNTRACREFVAISKAVAGRVGITVR